LHFVNKMSHQRKIWEGKIPLCICAASHELNNSDDKPMPLFLMVSRVSYLPLINKQVAKYFEKYTDTSGDIWYEYDGKPLTWHLPTGHLFDINTGYLPDVKLPWNITVHFQSFPTNKIIKYNCEEAIQSTFLSSLKEADNFKHSGEIVQNLTKDQHVKLWHGIKTNNYEGFWDTCKLLMQNHPGLPTFQSIPMILYHEDTILQRKLTLNENSTLDDAIEQYDGEIHKELGLYKLVSHGVELSKDCNLNWLSVNLCYPDNFLHICLFKTT